MQKKKSFIVMLTALVMSMVFVACRGNDEASAQGTEAASLSHDRMGFEISLPDEISRIVSIAPANTEIIMALGFGDLIVAADDQNVVGFDQSLAVLSMWGIDLEYIISLEPDVVIASGMIMFQGDPLVPLRDLGIAVVYVPVSESVAEVKEDIRFLAAVFGVASRGEEIIAEMETGIAEIEAIIDTIEVRRRVYFEVSAAPFTFGSDTFTHEMLTIAGGINIFYDLQGWPQPSLEDVIDRNPEVILTSTNYIDDPVGEILGRTGFSVITAVENSNVHFIDTDYSNRPNHMVVRAIRQMAEAIYPEYFR